MFINILRDKSLMVLEGTAMIVTTALFNELFVVLE